MPQVTVTPQIKKQLTNVSVGDKLSVNAAGVLRVTTPQTKAEFLKENYAALLDSALTLTEAAAKYKIPRGTISSWVYYTNYLAPIDDNEYPKRFPEAEIAMLVDIYQQRRADSSKAPLLDDNGLPYELKHPGLAAARKNKRDSN